MSGKRWTAAQKRTLAARYPHEHTAVVARDLGVSLRAAYGMAHSLGLRKAADYEKPGRDNLVKYGAKSRFQPGQTPWNKGMSYHAAGRSVETQFKPGQMPVQTQPLGSHRIKDGVLQRKVSNESGRASRRWRGVHELVWVKHNGPVPEGHFVRFRRGMKTTELEEITIDRVELVTRASNMQRNSVHNYPQPIPRLVQLRGVLARRINTRKRDGQEQHG